MENKEKNNENLSFDDLKKQLGMAESDVKENKPVTKPTPAKTKVNIDNDDGFVDITAQFVNTEEEEPEQKVEKPVEAPKPPVKKRVKTFNEIFSDAFKAVIPTKSDSAKEKMRKVVMDISIIAIVCCVFAFIDYFGEYRTQVNIRDELKGQIISTDGMNDNQYNEAWKDLYAKFPNMNFPTGMKADYAYLYAANQDFVGWLKIDNTSLDIQVVQSKDNDYYLKRDFYKNSNRYGCPFMDYKNNSKELDDNTLIYGHHMSDGSLFANLDGYKTLEGYKKSPIINFSTLYQDYQFKVFAVFISTSSPSTDNGFNYMITDFASDEKFNSFINEVRLRSIINTNVTVNANDKIITLATCSHEFDDARLVIMGRLVRENENAAVDVDGATLNPQPKYPQAWYDKKGKDNPYANNI
ncbi:MAG: class B sortase [Clostridia bacterium]|nr:class B sortase [Clostridia bacterium]